MKRILFVCTGNYFRSRFAEIYFNHRNGNEDHVAFSRGFKTDNPGNSGHVSPHTIEKLAQLRIPLPVPPRFPEKLDETDLLDADVVISLYEKEHRSYVRALFPEWEEKFIFWNIKDIDEEDPDATLEKLRHKTDDLILHLSKSL